ncbi:MULTISPECIES: flagellar protein FlgN [Bacillaceae]|uniref:flagellar protein FlgN n=1 Tax=Bacillaceae TaxID=186817 RepID=UPI001E314881|nr:MULTISPECIES: flagellar protein FlgN [Bacillaceae]MCE4049428.1 flagellar protein FlgN [Bacillus sp. Au-Bac7]MDL0437611.1 flagellar protein FlgN [Niallia sp. SS-2023]UPO87215.1 flagellar protein FlgN [Niallia sp. Man26]
MSASLLIEVLEKLVNSHASLYEVAKNKTEIIKKGDIESLQQVMKDEQAHIMSIQKLEAARVEVCRKIVKTVHNPTISDCLELMEPEPAKQAGEAADKLRSIIGELKDANTLNQQLLRQSMQFVNVSLSLLKPTKQSLNYGKPVNGNSVHTGNIGKTSSSLLNMKA